jgi:hypothetical protein
MKQITLNINQIQLNKSNPRIIKDDNFDKLVNSIKDFPEMLDIRPIVVNKDMVILGGNMRYKACVEAGLTEIPVIVADNLTVEQEKEFLIKDNVSGGEWDWSAISGEWDVALLEDWGLEVIGFGDVDPDDFGDDFDLKDGGKTPFQQITFSLADKQAEQIKNAMADAKKLEEFKYIETFANENGNGNALYLIVSQWVGQKK